MKIGGKKIDSRPASEMIVFPRPEGNDIALRISAIMDREPFDRLCPPPKAKMMLLKGGVKVENTNDEGYLIEMRQWNQKYMDWMFITSLCSVDRVTKQDIPIEWEIVNPLDHTTWGQWEEELKQSGFSDIERKRLYTLMMMTNSLSDTRLDEARRSFLLPAEVIRDQSSFLTSEPNDIQSGQPANESESDRQESQLVGTN